MATTPDNRQNSPNWDATSKSLQGKWLHNIRTSQENLSSLSLELQTPKFSSDALLQQEQQRQREEVLNTDPWAEVRSRQERFSSIFELKINLLEKPKNPFFQYDIDRKKRQEKLSFLTITPKPEIDLNDISPKKYREFAQLLGVTTTNWEGKAIHALQRCAEISPDNIAQSAFFWVRIHDAISPQPKDPRFFK